MKKLILFILAVMQLLLPALALADWPGGTAWTHSSLSAEGAPYMEYIYFADDGSCYYAAYLFHRDSDAFGRTYNGTWELLPSGAVHAKTGEHTELKLIFSNDQEKAMDEDNPTNFFYFVYTFDLD